MASDLASEIMQYVQAGDELHSRVLLCLFPGVSSGVLVTQTPDVSVVEGETVNITCCWTGKFSGRITINWLKNQTNIKTETLKRHSDGSLREETSNCSVLTFTTITRQDSERYTCTVSVDIPHLFVYEGNGTVITVMARDNTKDNTTGGRGQNSSGLTGLSQVFD